MRWQFSEGIWYGYKSEGDDVLPPHLLIAAPQLDTLTEICVAMIECKGATRTVWTTGGHQEFSKFTHTLEDLQRLAGVLVRLEL
jgi:hypothetical protein